MKSNLHCIKQQHQFNSLKIIITAFCYYLNDFRISKWFINSFTTIFCHQTYMIHLKKKKQQHQSDADFKTQ